ncbi:MAG: hypothetical protein ABR571_16570 [Jatrophihabitans sp.]|uniref:hypothetical protein n=1 Tax=Jatrophihabitans sp. TaxID=1932789 RepID=UPI003912B5BF
MTDRTLGRVGAAGGAAFVVLALAAGGGQGPANDASREQIGRYFTTAKTIGGFTAAGPLLEILAMLCLLVFWSRITGAVRRVESDEGWLHRVVYGAGVGSVILKLSSFPAAFALHSRSGKGVDPALLTALYDMNNAAFVLGWAASGVALLGVAVAALRYGALPRWIGYGAAAIGPALLLAVPFADGPGPVAFLALLLWLGATSLTLMIRPEQASKPEAAPSISTSAAYI